MKRFFITCGVVLIVLIAGLGIVIYPVWQRAEYNYYNPERGCASNLKQIALAIFMYDQDYDGKLPPAIFPGKTVGWANGVQPYLRSYPIFQCPLQRHTFSEDPKPDQPGFTDYWMNSNLAGLEEKKVINPNQIILLGDGDGNSPASTASYAINRLPASWLQLPDPPMTRHLGGAKYVFADGHVKWLKPYQVSQLPSSEKHPVFTFVNK